MVSARLKKLFHLAIIVLSLAWTRHQCSGLYEGSHPRCRRYAASSRWNVLGTERDNHEMITGRRLVVSRSLSRLTSRRGVTRHAVGRTLVHRGPDRGESPVIAGCRLADEELGRYV